MDTTIFENDIKKSIHALETGGIMIYPTDTVWGIGCDALNSSAIDQVFNVKNRNTEKSLIVLLADSKDIFQYIAAPPPDIISIVEGFDTPTTIIFDHAIGFPENAIHKNGSIAIRITTDPFCKALIKRFRKPIISTSANISGQPTAQNYIDINPKLLDDVDYIVKYRQEDTTPKQPSRIVRINNEGLLEIIRA